MLRTPVKRKPWDAWEALAWGFFDKVKSALAKQDRARDEGTLESWLQQAEGLFMDITDILEALREENPPKMMMAYSGWLASQKLAWWDVPNTGPLTWTPPMRPGEAITAESTAKWAAWRAEDAARRKAMTAAGRNKLKIERATQRAVEREAARQAGGLSAVRPRARKES